MKKLTSKDWDAIQQKRPARYFIQNVEDGTIRLMFETEIYKVESGDQDGLGNVWEKDWSKIEGKIKILDCKDKSQIGLSKIYSLGGEGFSFFGDFIACCKRNGLTPDKIPGSVFDITKTGDWEQEISYVGQGENATKSSKPIDELSEDDLGDAKEVIENLKMNSPDLVSLGFSKEDFLKILSIRGKIKPSDGESILPKLEEDKILTLKDNKVTIL